MVNESAMLLGREMGFLLSVGERSFSPRRELAAEAPFSPAEEALGQLMHEATELLSHWAKLKGISYGVEISPGAGRRVLVDRTLLLWSLACLTVNGVRYTEHGEVVLTVSPGSRGGWLRFQVRDSGVGISPDGIEALFDAGDEVGADSAGGGNGRLPLCRGLVERMGGFVRVESRVGVGSTFTLEIPADEESLQGYAL